MKFVKTYEKFLNEAEQLPVKYVVWDLYSRDNKKVEQCSVTFTNKIEYHAQLPRTMEQHHPKLFEIKGGKHVRTPLALELGVIPPRDSFSLACGLEKKIKDFLQFWEDEGYELVYDEPTDNEELFENYIKKSGLTKFTKERL